MVDTFILIPQKTPTGRKPTGRSRFNSEDSEMTIYKGLTNRQIGNLIRFVIDTETARRVRKGTVL